jgi:RNA-directed DNA polymerase
MTDELSLNPHWRNRVKEIGRMNFTREEMLRLGFYTELDESEQERIKAFLDEAYPRLAELKKELEEVSTTIAEMEDVQSILKEVRRTRIERVRREREERKARKELENAARKKAWKAKKSKTPPFLGVGVSANLQFDGGDDKRLLSRDLPSPQDIDDLASSMEISNSELLWLCYERAAATVDHYTRFEIAKKSGGARLISSPKPKMRAAQRWILDNILAKLSPSDAATAFRPGASIIKNAEPHVGSAILVRIDFEDFFPSITFPRVRGFFEALGYNPGVSTILSLISTDAPRVKVNLDGRTQFVAMDERSLPQGACTSPALANLIAWKLDARITGLVQIAPSQWTYTRYADDLTLSSRDCNAKVGWLLGSIQTIASGEGFRINKKKTKIMRAPSRRIVTGLVVDKDIRLSRRDLRNFRAFLHRCDKDGLIKVSGEIGKDALAVARGRMAFVQMVMPDHAIGLRQKYSWL